MISRFDIEKLQALPIEEVASALGLSVSHHKALCPFHNDSNPSLTFHRGRNRYRCFVCDAHGGTIDLVMNHLHYSFLDACRWLNDHSGSLVDFDKFSNQFSNNFERSDHKEKPFDASRYARFFDRPWLSNEARKFLFEERHLDPRVVRWCRLTSWRDKQGTPWLQIPYYDRQGNLIGIQNRNLAYGKGSSFQSSKSEKNLVQNQSNDSDKFSSRFSNNFERSDHQPRFRFPSGAKCSIYNLPVLNLLKPGETLFIAEGCSDCWSLLSAGHKAIAIPSATLLTRKDAELLGTLNLELGTRFHIFPDQDTPGEQLYNRLVEASIKYGFTLVRHQLPSGCKDFSDFYLQKYLEPGTWNLELGTWNLEPGTWNLEP